MPCLAFRILMPVLVLAVFLASGMAQEPRAAEQPSGITAKLNAWGRFEPGVWKLVRVVTETLNEQGQVVSTNTTDTRTTLLDIDNEGVTLEIEACMEVAGKRFQSDPQTVKQGFHGEIAGPNIKLKTPTDGELVIEDRKIPCKVQQLESAGSNGRTNVTLYYSTELSPFVLKRESVATDPDGKTVLGQTSVEVIAFDMPVRVRNESRNGVCVKTVHKNAKGTVTTLAMTAPGVPGGVVSHSMKEVDKNGRLVRRSTLELLDYDADSNPDGGPYRKRPPRRTKQPAW